MTVEAVTVQAVQLAKEGKAKEAVKLLEEHAKGENYLPIKLACLQLLLSNEEKNEAIKILENLSETEKALPGIVSTLVTLHTATGDREKASAVLKNAVNYYKNNKVNYIFYTKYLKINSNLFWVIPYQNGHKYLFVFVYFI